MILLNLAIILPRSGLFRAVLGTEFKEKPTEKLEVKDTSGFSFETLRVFFRFVYSEEFGEDLKKVSDKALEELKKCKTFFQLNSKSSLDRHVDTEIRRRKGN